MNTTAADLIVLTGSGGRDGFDELIKGAELEGYRVVRRSGNSAVLVTSGHGLDILTEPLGSAVVVVGETADHSPATRFAGLAPYEGRGGAPVNPAIGARAMQLAGHFAAALVADDAVHVVTDHVGSVPLYRAQVIRNSSPVQIVGTGLEAVRRIAGCNTLDPASVREFIEFAKVTSPFTFYREVLRLDAGTVVRLDSGSGSLASVGYWAPREEDAPGKTAAEVAAVLHDTMLGNLGALADRTSSALILYSGGEDARVLAAMACRAEMDLSGLIFLEEQNRELTLARLSARLIGMPLSMRVRSADHYTAGLADVIKRIGPGIDAIDAHARGLVASDEADLVLDGWTSDSYYKGLYANRTQRRLGPVAIGLWRTSRDPGRAAAVGHPDPPVPSEVTAAVVDRRRAHLERLIELRPGSGTEWGRLWPVSDHPDYGFFAFNRRTVPSASPYMWGNALDVIRGLPESEKLNRRLFRAAFGSEFGLAGLVPRSGGEIPLASPRVGLALTAGISMVFAATARVCDER